MLAVIIVTILAAATGTVIWIRNGAKQLFRERGWALFILLVGTLLAIGLLLRLPIPNPTDWIMTIFSPVYKPIVGWVEEGL